MKNLTTFDWLKVVGYIIGFGGMLTPQIVATILGPYGVDNSGVTHVIAIIGSVVTVATLISNIFKNPSTPTGSYNVLSTSPTPTADSLTTTATPTPVPPKGP